MKAIAVYDNKGKTLDRYTIVFNEKVGNEYTYLGVSGCHVTYGISFSQWGLTNLPKRQWSRMGTKIEYGDLPSLVRLHIKGRLNDEYSA